MGFIDRYTKLSSALPGNGNGKMHEIWNRQIVKFVARSLYILGKEKYAPTLSMGNEPEETGCKSTDVLYHPKRRKHIDLKFNAKESSFGSYQIHFEHFKRSERCKMNGSPKDRKANSGKTPTTIDMGSHKLEWFVKVGGYS